RSPFLARAIFHTAVSGRNSCPGNRNAERAILPSAHCSVNEYEDRTCSHLHSPSQSLLRDPVLVRRGCPRPNRPFDHTRDLVPNRRVRIIGWMNTNAQEWLSL